MNQTALPKVVVFGGAGRVGFGLAAALLQKGINVVVVDNADHQRLSESVARMQVDARLMNSDAIASAVAIGDMDVLDQNAVTDLLLRECPDVVVNYAIPFTWDAAKQLANYANISAAGLGAFAAVQVLAPKLISQALAQSKIHAQFVVGNLPDITNPILHGLQHKIDLIPPIAGAGNVGLIEAALRHQIANELKVAVDTLTVYLVAHHIHWVAPREPGYQNDAPFLLKVLHEGQDITANLGNLRELMNRSINRCYEPGAGFSSTTSLLAAQLISALLDKSDTNHELHVPAPHGLSGGYPVQIENGSLSLRLPDDWTQKDAETSMRAAHRRDGIDHIGVDGSIHFDPNSVAILKRELGIVLPEVVKPNDLEDVAKEQIRVAQKAISAG